MRWGALTLLVLVAAVAAPAASAQPSFKVPATKAGDIGVAHVVFKAKGKPRLVLVNGGALTPDMLAVGGVKRLGGDRWLASLAVAHRIVDRAGEPEAVTARLKVKRGAHFRFVRKQGAANIAESSSPPRFCKSVPKSFSYVAGKALHGSLMSEYDAPTTARFAYLTGCGSFPERAAFLRAIRGGSDSGEGGGTGGATCESDQPGCPDDTPQGPATSDSLQGSGSVTRDASDPDLFTYTISFNQPVYGYRIQVPTNDTIRCPAPSYAARYGECESLGNSNSPTAGSMTLRCESPGSQHTYEFGCTGPVTDSQGGDEQYAEIPAGTTITGRFRIEPGGSVGPGSVQVIGLQAGAQGRGVESRPAALSGP